MFFRALFCLALAAGAQGQSVHFQWVQQIGGSQGQSVVGVATDPAGNTYVVGNTSSLDFPVKSGIQSKLGGAGLYRVDGPGKSQGLDTGLLAVNVIAASPTNPQTLFATDGRTLKRSGDGGASWSTLSTFTGLAGGLAVDPTSPNLIYAATYATGILKSTDGGVTFTPINNGVPPFSDGNVYAFRIVIDPKRPSVLLAATSEGLVRSSDAGATWQRISSLGKLDKFNGLTFDGSTGTAYVSTGTAIQKSTDDGATWSALPAPQVQYFGIGAIVPDPTQPGTIYAGGYSGLWKSTDGGNTWDRKDPLQVFLLAVDSAGTVYYGVNNTTVRVSTDGLATSTAMGLNFSIIDTIAVLGTHLFVGTDAGSDVYVTKLDPQGNPIFATYFGGTSSDYANAMAVDSTGAVYATGTTGSSDFPVTKGAYATSGGSFLFKLNSDGSLGYSTYFAPTGNTPTAIAVDAAGTVYLTGATLGSLPVTPGAYQSQLKGTYPPCCGIGPGPPPVTNAFLTRFDASGSSLLFSTYIGSQYQFASTLAVDKNGEAVLAGGSQLYRMSSDGGSLLSSLSFPGQIYAVAVDADGNVFAGGSTYTVYQPPFPITPGAFETGSVFPVSLSTTRGFVTRFDKQFHVVASTLLSGEGGDQVSALSATPNGNILAGGSTNSKAFPLRGAAQGSFSNTTGFLAELTPDLTSAIFSTFAGDTRTFTVRSVAPAPDGGVIFAGSTSGIALYSTFFAFSVGSAPNNGQSFIVKSVVTPAAPRIDTVVNAASQLGVGLSAGSVFQVRGDGFGDDAVLLVNGAAVPLLLHTGTSLTAELPLDIAASGAVTVAVQSGGGTSNQYLAPFLPTSPGLYTADGSGVGQAYILNADGTVNTPSNPAKEGEQITLFATGVGHMTFDHGYAVTDFPVIVAIDGFGAPGIGASYGPVDGFPGDVYQLSVYVPRPADFAAGNPNLKDFKMPPTAPITLTLNGITSQLGVSLSIGQ
jgi:uncharacterized protein (TIGR03437 family)